MTKTYPEKTVFAVLCFLAVFSSLVSGAIYPYSAKVFTLSAFICLLITLAGDPVPVLVRLWPAWALAAAAWLSCLWTVNLNLTVQSGFMLTAMAVFSYLAAFSLMGDRKNTAIKLLLAAACVVSLYGLYQYAYGLENTRRYLMEYGGEELGIGGKNVKDALYTLGYRRAFSTMMSPNVLACYLAMVFPAGLSLLLDEKRSLYRVLYGLSLAMLLACAVATKSVGGMLAFASGAAAFVIMWAYLKGGNSARNAAAGMAAVLLAGCVIGYFVVSARTGGFFGIDKSVTERMNYFSGAYDSFLDAPLAGNGAGSFQLTFLSRVKPGATESRYAHDLLLQTMSETGVIGLCLVIAVFAVFFRRCISAYRDDPEAGAAYIGVAAGGAAFFVHNLVDFTWYVHDTAFVWWLYFGIASSAGARSMGDRSKGIAFAARMLVVAAAAVFLAFYSMSAFAARYQKKAVQVLTEAGAGSTSDARSGPVPEEAFELARRAVALKPYDDGYLAFLAYLCEGEAYTGGVEYAKEAAGLYGEAIRLNPLYAYHYRDLGILYMKLGDRERAVAMLRKALDASPSDKRLAALLAETEK